MMKRPFIMSVLLTALMLAPATLIGAELEVPRYLSYQSVLMDDGGNALTDGRHEVFFRLIGASGEVLFEEKQDVEVAGGVASVILGSGVSADGTMSNGGIPAEALKPDGARYLEVQTLGNQPMDRLELVSVPYSIYADVAAHVGNGAVGSEGIDDGAVQMKHLSKDLINELAVALSSSASSPLVSRSDMGGISGASYVGINSTFVYSGARDVEQVLRDMDMAIANRHAESVKKSGDVMNGTLDMGGNPIVNVGVSGGQNDILTLGAADERYVNSEGNDVIHGNLEIDGDMTIKKGHEVVDVGDRLSDIGHIPGNLGTSQIPAPLAPHAWAVFKYDGGSTYEVMKTYGIGSIAYVKSGFGEILLRVSFEKGTTDANYFVSINTDANGACTYNLIDEHDKEGSVVKAARRTDGINIGQVHCGGTLSMFNLMVFAN